MGLISNLIEIWEPYKAARLALNNTIQSSNVKDCSSKHSRQLEKLITQLRQLLKEGVLTEEFLLDNMQKLTNLIRQANVTLRWMLLHTNALTPGEFLFFLFLFHCLFFLLTRQYLFQLSKVPNP